MSHAEPHPRTRLPLAGAAAKPHSLAGLSVEQLRSQNWRWQMANRVRTVGDLSLLLEDFAFDEGLLEVEQRYPFAVTPYYLSLVRRATAEDPVFRMAIPESAELQDAPALFRDPLVEEDHEPVPGCVHRYPDRVVLLVNGMCPVYCRHCTRKRFVGIEEAAALPAAIDGWVDYLRRTPEVKDVILSGGDPLTLGTARIERILEAVRSVPSVEVVRIGTRIPVLMPMRVTENLVSMLRRYQPWVVTHFNHPRELTPEAATACARLVDAGIPVNNQSVLLRGVNDHPDVMEDLCRGLMRMRVRPYYLHQCDLVQGIEHLRTPISRGIQIMEALRGRLGGLAIPQYVVDLPQGGGKVPLLPNYILSSSPETTVLRNFEGRVVAYPEPQHLPAGGDRSSAVPRRGGIADLLSGAERGPIVPRTSD